MFFDKDPDPDCTKYGVKMPFDLKELKEQKKRLEEYYDQLIFIGMILDEILWTDNSELICVRNTRYIGRALNALLYDKFGERSYIHRKDIESYKDKISKEMFHLERRIKGIGVILYLANKGTFPDNNDED